MFWRYRFILRRFSKKISKVFAFEFLEANLEVFNKNMELNPHFKDIIELIERPLGPKTNEMLYAKITGRRQGLQPTLLKVQDNMLQ